jgi:tetratricopeptide (TPR) repeat protein
MARVAFSVLARDNQGVTCHTHAVLPDCRMALSWLLVLAATATAQIPRDVSRVDDLINDGKYVEAARYTKAALTELRVGHGDEDRTVAFLSYAGRLCAETGGLDEASRLLAEAEALARRVGVEYHLPTILRQKAAIQYTIGDYSSAAITADEAWRLSVKENYYRVRAEYARSVRALALLRMGKTNEAEDLALLAANAVEPRRQTYKDFVPRILYAACLVESELGNHAAAGTYCQRGLEMASRAKHETRELSLGYLSRAEAYFKAGDTGRSRASALKAIEITGRLFGRDHQDVASAMDLLTQISLKEGNAAEACARAAEAAKIASKLFGERVGRERLERTRREIGGCELQP